jgi:ribosomal-protein-alanine N-acetyltransferase
MNNSGAQQGLKGQPMVTQSDSYRTREFVAEDLDPVIMINRKCLPENYPSGFFVEISDRFPKSFLVTELVKSKEIVGYIMGRIERGLSNYGFRLTKKGHIVSVAVLHEYRNLGVGLDLVSKSLKAMEDYGATEFVLEVRESNMSAISLYKKLGFENSKMLKGYYSDGEDAYLMSKRV